MFRYFLFFILLFIAKEAYSQKNSLCHRDYSLNCAEGWSKLINSEECVSPLSYKGPCPRFLQIEHETKKKKKLEQLCSIYWPCLVECKKNYSQCPERWVLEDDKKCHPMATYEGWNKKLLNNFKIKKKKKFIKYCISIIIEITGTCLFSYDFSNMTDEQKEIWSNKCGTTWPCKEKCKKDYSKICPQEWIRDDDGLCSAPKSYNGPCLSRASLFSLDKDMKVAFEKLCKLDYPCLKECDIDMNDPCPQNWILKSDESGTPLNCLPPNNYKGACDENTKFIGLNLEVKESIAYECDIKWPCAEEIPNLINYDKMCPEDWIQNEDYCISPQSYMGPCSKKKLFNSFIKEIKKAYAEECNVKWPLLTSIKSEKIPKSSVLRKGKYNYGAVEPITGEIASIIQK